MHGKYTKLKAGQTVVPHTIKTSLTPSLGKFFGPTGRQSGETQGTKLVLVRLNPSIAEEVEEALLLEMPPCEDWTPVNINEKLLRIVAMVSGRVFVGPELCRSEEYLDAAIHYTLDLMTAQRAVSSLAPWKRPFLGKRLPQVKKLDQRLAEATAFLRPVVEARQRLPVEEQPDDMLQWLMSAQPKFGDHTAKKMAELQLGISFAAIHTTTLTSTNA